MNVRRLPLACLFSATLVSRLATAEDGPSLVPYAQQSAFLFLSDSVTAGGIGGGVGAQGTYQSNYVAQLDLNALWMLGNSYAIRLALGYQRDATWCPAIWLTTGTLWGDRIEFLSEKGERPHIPTWAVGVRASPLRFRAASAFASALEPGIGTDFSGGTWLELSLLQAGAWF